MAPALTADYIIRVLDKKTSEQLHINVNDHNIETWSFDLDMQTLYARDSVLLELSKNRVVADPRYKDAIVDYLYNEYRDRKAKSAVRSIHHGLGWKVLDGKELFLYDQNAIGSSVSYSDRKDFKFRSGDEALYKDFLQKTVYPVPTLALAMTLGYAAPVISRLQNTVPDLRTVIVNLCGASSTGKTTAEELLVSAFGCPAVTNGEGLIHPFFATTNAIFAAMEGINGLPIALDDTTANDRLDLHSLIYTLATGEEKARCNSDGTRRESRGNWSGLVVISSETPILDNGNLTQGQNVRVLQTQGITWTPDAATAELIKRTVRENYGFTGYDFAKYLGKIKEGDLYDRYMQSRERVHALMTVRDSLSDRLEEKYAAIHLTVGLMNECFDLTLNADELLSIMLKPEQESVAERDIALKGEMAIRSFIAENRKHFDWTRYNENAKHDMAENFGSGSYYGTVRMPNEVYMFSHKVDEVLKSAGIFETTTVKKRWKERGLTKCDTGRYDCKFNGTRAIHFIFKEGISFYPDLGPMEPQPPVSEPAPLQETPISDYAVDDTEAIEEIFRGEA